MDLARAECELEAMRLLNWRMAASVAADTLTADESSSIKVFGTERTVEVYRLLLGIVGVRRLPGARHRPGPSCGAAWRPRAARPRSTPSAAG